MDKTTKTIILIGAGVLAYRWWMKKKSAETGMSSAGGNAIKPCDRAGNKCTDRAGNVGVVVQSTTPGYSCGCQFSSGNVDPIYEPLKTRR